MSQSSAMAFCGKNLSDMSLWLREKGFTEAIVDVFAGS